jgi:RHS repeat-associated protein
VAYDTSNNSWTTQRYYPYGSTRSGGVPTDRLFTGQRFDGTIGLYDYGARFYDPALGRFVQADTIVPNPANPQDLNRYAYVRNNPLSYVDPSGQAPCGPYCRGDWINRDINFGMAYCGPWDPAQQARNRARAKQTFALLTDLTPGVGDLKGLVEVGTGTDLATGEELGNWRWLGLAGLSELRHLRHADEAVDVIKAASRVNPEWLKRWVKRTEQMHWIPETFHPQVKELFPEITREVLQFTEPLEVVFHRYLHRKGAKGTLHLAYNARVQKWLFGASEALNKGVMPSLDEFLQFIADLRAEYLDLYEEYLTLAVDS